jgi:DNA recombination protein RmuC
MFAVRSQQNQHIIGGGMSEILFSINGIAVSQAAVTAVLCGIAVLLILGLLIAQSRQSRARALESQEQSLRVEELQQQLFELLKAQSATTGQVQFLAQGFGAKQEELGRAVNERLDAVTHRLGENMTKSANATAESLSKLNERLAVVDAAQGRMQELTSHMLTLKDVLANKQARGAFGQGRMEAIVADALPKKFYAFQHTLRNGKRPDCVIFFPGEDIRPLTIDAKFPLEAVTALRESQAEESRRAALSRLKQDINKHVSDISERYLVPGETQDIALMFVPSESVYADLHEHCDDVMQKAFRQRIILVSPSLLMLAVQVIQATVRDARFREQIELIRNEVGKLLDDVRRLRDRAGKLQTHFAHTAEDVAAVLTSAEKISKRGEKVVAYELEDDSAPKDTGAPAAVPLQLKLGGRE